MFSFISFKVFHVFFQFHLILPILLIDPADMLGNRFVILAIAAMIAYLSRFILIRFMNHWMTSK